MDHRSQILLSPEPDAPRAEPMDDDLEIRYSLTSLGELAVARGDRGSRGPRFRGFGPCVAVA